MTMNPQFVNLLIIGAIFGGLFFLGEFLYHVVHLDGEHSRKIIHLSTGFITLLFPVFFQDHWYVLVLCTLFAVVLQVSIHLDFLHSINKIDRRSFGSIAYPAAVYAVFLFYRFGYREPGASLPPDPQMPFYFIPVLTLAVCDPLAAVLGKRFPYKPYKVGNGTKTVTGSLAFFVSALLVTFIVLFGVFHGFSFGEALLIALLVALPTTFAEAFSRHGLDNLTVPGAAMLVLYLVSHYTSLYHNVNH